MLALRMLLSGGHHSYEQDLRPVEKVLAAAADRIRKPREPAIIQTLMANDLECAWQLATLSPSEWETLGVPIGLRTAIRAELANPTVQAISTQEADPTGEFNQRKRRFLLLPDAATGEAAKPLGKYSATFLGLLTTPVEDRQNLLLALCELLALVSGLLFPISLTFRNGPASLATEGATKGWDVRPSITDGQDAVMVFVFCLGLMVTWYAIQMSMFIAASGYHADDEFVAGAMEVISVLFFAFFLGVLTPLLLLAVWHIFTDSGSPYPAIGTILIFWILNRIIYAKLAAFQAIHTPLEFYHLPRKWKVRSPQLKVKPLGLSCPNALMPAPFLLSGVGIHNLLRAVDQAFTDRQGHSAKGGEARREAALSALANGRPGR